MRHALRSWAGPGLVFLAASASGGEPPAIRHEAPGCLVAESFPRLLAVVTPADQVVRARLLFRPEAALTTTSTTAAARPASGGALSETDPLDGGGGRAAEAPGWYAVAMTRDGDAFSAVLPRPRMAVRKVRYLIEVTDASAATARSEEKVVEVVGAPDACPKGTVAEVVASAQVVVEVPPGAPLIPPVPQGFSAVGATAVEGALALVRKGGHKGLLLALGGAALGGAAAASQLAGDHSPARVPTNPPQPGFTLVSALPAGGIISVSRPLLDIALRIVPAEALPAATLNARLYGSVNPSRTCGRMHRDVAGLDPSASQLVRLSTLEDASACGPVDRIQLSLDSQGRVVLATGGSQPDLVISFVFAP